jgi:hypothetical protein
VHLQIEIIYSASWNGSYSYASGSLNHLVPLSGTGQKNVSITFVGNIFSGIHYQVAFQKNDSSSGTLTVSVTSDVLGSQTHSNSSAFGIVEFGQGVISWIIILHLRNSGKCDLSGLRSDRPEGSKWAYDMSEQIDFNELRARLGSIRNTAKQLEGRFLWRSKMEKKLEQIENDAKVCLGILGDGERSSQVSMSWISKIDE